IPELGVFARVAYAVAPCLLERVSAIEGKKTLPKRKISTKNQRPKHPTKGLLRSFSIHSSYCNALLNDAMKYH
ncbi:hypothetical protein, partial [Secundilactobacillus collinoides]|uniref:hypothetical protein n=1 Tax=Secundilactobacillus collinoides TaxID=33960 RepID=UPI001FB3BB72